MEFGPDNVAQLKSGGPLMEAGQIGKTLMTGEDSVWGARFEKVGNRQAPQHVAFRTATLKKSTSLYTGSFSLLRA